MLATLLCLPLSGAVRAGDGVTSALDGSFRVRNLLPTALRAGLPEAPDPWAGPELALTADRASHFVFEQDAGGRRLVLDGETQRVGIAGRFPLSRRSDGAAPLLELAVDGVRHDGGFLDGFIEAFHGAFGFPNAGRERVPRDRLRLAALEPGGTSTRVTDAVTDPGQAHAALAWPLGRNVLAHGVVAVPLGAPEAFTAAEAPTLSAGVSTRRALGTRIYLGGSVAATRLGGATFRADRRWTVQGRATIGLRLRPGLHLRAQLDGATPLGGGAFEGHGDPVLQGTLGGALRLRGPWSLEVSVAEDPSVDSAPDVIFQLRLVRRP